MTTVHASAEWKPIQERWPTLRQRVATYWTRLTAEDVEQLPGDRASLVALVKKTYALASYEAEAQVDTWLAGMAREMEPPPARTFEEQRAEAEGMGAVPGATEE